MLLSLLLRIRKISLLKYSNLNGQGFPRPTEHDVSRFACFRLWPSCGIKGLDRRTPASDSQGLLSRECSASRLCGCCCYCAGRPLGVIAHDLGASVELYRLCLEIPMGAAVGPALSPSPGSRGLMPPPMMPSGLYSAFVVVCEVMG